MNTNRPKIKIPNQTLDTVLELILLSILVITWVYVFIAYPELPETIASHFNAKGEADGFSSKSSIWILTLMSTILAVGMYVLAKFPHMHNYMVNITEENALLYYRMSSRLLRYVSIFIALLFLYITYMTIQHAQGKEALFKAYFTPFIIGSTLIGVVALFIYQQNIKKKDPTLKKS